MQEKLDTLALKLGGEVPRILTLVYTCRISRIAKFVPK